MRTFTLLLSVLLLFGLLACSPIPEPQDYSTPGTKEYPDDWFYRQRAYPQGQINKQVFLDALRDKMAMAQVEARNTTAWKFIGPNNTGGRVTDVEMHPSSLDIIYVGTASGGIFKSETRGESWRPIFDDALSLSIGDIGIAPSDPNILYAGTGEANGGGGSIAYDGAGIYKSTNGGDSWQHLGLENIGGVGKLLVHPEDPSRAWVAAMGTLFANNDERGVYRTTDGGQNWEQVLFVSDSTGAIDLAMHPADPDILYASMWERVRRPDRRQYGGVTSGIYRSSNGGNSWTELAEGLPEEDKGRIGIAVTPAAPNNVYAIYTDEIGFHKGIYRSNYFGENWTTINSDSLNMEWVGGVSYAWWFGGLFVHPQDPESIFAFSLFAYRTKNGGEKWDNINYNDSVEVHVDPHALYIHPQNPDFIVLGNDGGVYISEDGGDNWDHKNTLPITQFYTCEVDYQLPERIYGGAQDNGTNRTLTGAEDDWQRILGGDGLVVKVDPSDNSIVYAEFQNGFLYQSTDGGNTFLPGIININLLNERRNWKTPYVLDPHGPQRIYYGTHRLFRTNSAPFGWTAISSDLTGNPPPQTPFFAYGTITSIDVSPVDGNVIYVGTDNGRVWRTMAGGGIANWNLLSTDLPDRWVTAVAAHPTDSETAYVTFSGYRYNEYLPHVFQTTDGGTNWNDVSVGLPEVPVNDIIIDPETPEWLYLATDVGVYYSLDEGLNWEVLGAGLPNIPVTDLCLHNPTRKLVAATYGRSMFSIQLDEAVSAGAAETPAYSLEVFPNPVQAEAFIRFEAPRPLNARIELFTLSGKKIRTIANQQFEAGQVQVPLDASALPAGQYLVRLHAAEKMMTGRFVKR